MQTVLSILPSAISSAIRMHMTADTEELRLRIGQLPCLIKKNTEQRISGGGQALCRQDFEYILSAASGSSVYAVNETLRQGFITLRGGHRIGFCGEAIVEHGEVKTFRNISSVVIRIARERRGIGISPSQSCLIIGPPGAGKTTFLRDTVRILSDECHQRVCLLDERSEVAASLEGKPQFDIGRSTDVLTGCPKADGMDMLVRAMSPQWVALDEITREADVESICRASYCGVKLLATAHAWSESDLENRPIYRQLCRHGIFKSVVILQPDHSYVLKGM